VTKVSNSISRLSIFARSHLVVEDNPGRRSVWRVTHWIRRRRVTCWSAARMAKPQC